MCQNEVAFCIPTKNFYIGEVPKVKFFFLFLGQSKKKKVELGR
jgi:hypothetical protein